MKVSQVWSTTEGDSEIAYIARVSNPSAKKDDSPVKLIRYLIDHKHWSPFEMVCMCLEIETTRDIGRQILRHRSFHFQEFSQRYSEVNDELILRDCRMQDRKNRQNSIPSMNQEIEDTWMSFQQHSGAVAVEMYERSIKLGIAKEVARALLPEGLTPTRMYMQGTIRDWIHYIAIRQDEGTQKEHRDIALECRKLLGVYFPTTFIAAEQAGII